MILSHQPEHTTPRRRQDGFSLVELLAVISIIVALASMSTLMLRDTLTAGRMNDATQQITDSLDYARQYALSQNRYVQVRLLAPAGGVRAGHYSSLQLFAADSPFYGSGSGKDEIEYGPWLNSGRFAPLAPIQRLPEGIILANTAEGSPLLEKLEADADAQRSGTTDHEGESYNWVSFYFTPDGSTDFQYLPAISTANSVITLCPLRHFIAAENKVPANFSAISINPYNGRAAVTRP